MNPLLGWALAAVLAFVSWKVYAWPGLAMAVSAIVFWLLLQFNRALRTMKNAAGSPLAKVPNAVMFHAGLHPGMTMLQIVGETKSIGRKVEGSDDDWRWNDPAGSSVRLHFEGGKLKSWQIERP